MKSFIASVVMGIVVYIGVYLVGWDDRLLLSRVIVIACAILGGAGFYVVLCRLFGVPEVMFLIKIIRDKVDKVGGGETSK